MDNLCCIDSTVAVRCCDFIYHGRSDPHTACNCDNSGAGKCHSRTEGIIDPENPALKSCRRRTCRRMELDRTRYIAESMAPIS
jgi:hypothetical protein